MGGVWRAWYEVLGRAPSRGGVDGKGERHFCMVYTIVVSFELAK